MRLKALLLALALTGCGLDREAVVLMLDPGYRAEILLDNEDGISAPDGLLWSNGRLYIADEGGSAVRSWAPEEPVRTHADSTAGLSSPEDLALGADGTLFVSDDDTGGVWRIRVTGSAVRLAPAVASSEGLVMNPSGSLLIGDPARARIVELTGAGHTSALRQRIAKAESFAFDGGGNLYIADNRDQTLYLRAPTGAVHRPIADQGGFSPESLHFASGALFITDSDHGKVSRYTPQDGLVTIAVFGGTLANVQGIASDELGNLYVSVQSDLEAGRGYIVRLVRN